MLNRRQFVLSGATAVLLSALPAAAAGPQRPRSRRSLRVAALQLQDSPWFWEQGLTFQVRPSTSGPRLVSERARIDIGIGARLGLQRVSAAMGDYRVDCRVGDVVVRRFEAPLLGRLLERGEALTAVLSACVGHSARVDVFLDRAPGRGQRIALPGTFRAHLLAPDADGYQPLQAGWWPVRRLTWHLPHHRFERKLSGSRGDDPYAQFTLHTGFNDLRPIPQERRAMYNDSPWPVFDPGVSIVTQQGRDRALIGLLDASRGPDALLHDGERLEARALQPDGLGAVLVELSVVA
jgi:hypothetical protein